MERSFGHFAHVLVDLDLSQELRYRVLVERKGYAIFVDFEYENLPDFCTHCNFTGHSLENCKRLKENKGKQPLVSNTKPRQEFFQKTKPAEVVPEELHSRSKDDVDLEIEVNEMLEAQLENQNKDAGQANFVTGCVDDESHSSANSEFVEATQQNFDSESSASSSTKDTQEVVQQNMEFLKASWAKLAETADKDDLQKSAPSAHDNRQVAPILFSNAESNDIHVEHTSNPHLDTDAFQQVISKNSKKLKNITVVQKASIIKSNYPIRSRVGTSKSLK